MPHFDKDAVLQAMTGRYEGFYAQFTPLNPLGGELRGPCPLHGGTGVNFAINPDTGLWNGFSGCQDGGDAFRFIEKMEGVSFPDALARVAEWAGSSQVISPASSPAQTKKRQRGPVVAEYDYHGADGQLLFQSVRYDPKEFSQRRPDGHGGWAWNLSGITPVLYRLPDVLAAVQAGRPVYVCEGEKDADALTAQGLTATTAPMGAKSKPEQWLESYTGALCGANVVILQDNDDAGRTHAKIVAAALHGTAKRVKIVELPGLPEKGDVSDFLSGGGTKKQFLALVSKTPDWTPPLPAHVKAEPKTVEAILPPAAAAWPTLDPLVYHGLAGDIVRIIEPHTEADPVAILVQLLLAFGSSIGRSAHFVAEADKHYTNLNAVLVGVSSKGRKGTSWGQVRRVFERVDKDWSTRCLQSGLSSGEGLIHAVRDPVEKQVQNKKSGDMETVLEDAGVDDKRLFVLESEFASVLRVAGRDGNTLSALLRDAWDKGHLQNLTKNSAAKATGAHISLVGHITADELRRELTSTEAGNGFANRFLWLMSRRSKELPEGGNLQEHELNESVQRLQEVREIARTRQELKRDAGARDVWLEVYSELSAGGAGLLGTITSRGEAQVMRLSLLYALLDGDSAIRREHLIAALALWEYIEASAQYVFGDSLGDAVADAVLRGLREAQNGLTRTEIGEKFSRHESSGRIDAALTLLHGSGRIRGQKENTGGRPIERWFIA